MLLGQLAFAAFGSASPAFAVVAIPVIFALYFWVISTGMLIPSAAVSEQAGIRSWNRSMSLIKGYRWPVLGTFFLAALCGSVLYLVLAAVAVSATVLISYSPFKTMTLISFAIPMSAFSIYVGYMCIVSTLIFMRLRELKEGTASVQIEAVFD